MKVLHFMNEVPEAFPAALAQRINERAGVDVIVASFYDNVDKGVRDGPLEVVTLDAKCRKDARAYARFRRLITDQDVDIVHTHPNATGAIARIVAATTDVAVVDTRHNDHQHFKWYRRLPNVPATAITDRFISNSWNTRESFSQLENLLLHHGGGQHEIVHNGIDLTQVGDLPSEPEDLPDAPRIISVARYVPQKNHETLVKAMALVRKSVPDASLILVGKGPRFDDISSLIEQLNLGEAIVQTGYLPQRAQVFSAVANSDVFAIPSWYEGFCIAAVEAMLTETPIVASDISVLREVVGDTGRFAPPDNPQQFADHIVELLENDRAREALGEQAGKRARSTFSLDRTADGYVRVYRDLIAEY